MKTKRTVTVSLSLKIIKQIDAIWKEEQAAALITGESVSKSSVFEKLLWLGIAEYKKRRKH